MFTAREIMIISNLITFELNNGGTVSWTNDDLKQIRNKCIGEFDKSHPALGPYRAAAESEKDQLINVMKAIQNDVSAILSEIKK